MAYGEPTTKKFKHSIISEHILEPEFQEIFCKHWHGRTAFKNYDIEIIAEPFRVCKISNFLKSEDFMDGLKNELIDVKSRRNSIDLYQFELSNDLVTAHSNNIKILYHTFQTNLSNWMQKNTEIVLNKTMSMSSSCYCDTDYLLCHDDNLGDRRIAFVLYLSKNWTEEDGGALDLFDTDEDGLPRNVVKSMIPEYNSLVIFEVANNSYHQVAEVLSPDKSRWSINGWFHGPVEQLDKVRPEPVIKYVKPEMTEVYLSQWISKNYLYERMKFEIHQNVEQQSFTFLSDFLKKDVYAKLTEEVQSADIKWKRVGPADVRNYEVADEDSLPETLADFCRIFKSVTVFELWRHYTELDLVPETEAMTPRVTIELQRWSQGCYTLITDNYNNEDNDVDAEASSDTRTLANTSMCDYEAAYEAAVGVGGESSSPPKTKLSRLQSNDVEEYQASEASEKSEKSVREDTSSHAPPGSQGDDESEEVEVPAKRRRTKKKTLRKKRRAVAVAASPPVQMPPPRKSRKRKDSDTDDSDVSDIGDYLSDHMDEFSDQEDGAEGDEVSGNAGKASQASQESQANQASQASQESQAIGAEGAFVVEEVIGEPGSFEVIGEPGSFEVIGEPGSFEVIGEPGSVEVIGEPGSLEGIEEPGSLDVIMQFNTGQSERQNIDYVDPRETDGALIHVPFQDNYLCLVYRTGATCRLHRYVNHYTEGYFYNLICTYLE